MGLVGEAKKGCLGGCLGLSLAIAVLIGVAVVATAYQMLNRTPQERAADAAKDEERELSAAAQARAKDFILKSLKSPKSADFPFLDWKVTPLGKSRFVVTSYVDSQNSFGANIRTIFNVVLRYKGGTTYDPQSWDIEKFNHNP